MEISIKSREITTFVGEFPPFIFRVFGELGNFPSYFRDFGGSILEPPKFEISKKFGKWPCTAQLKSFSEFIRISENPIFNKESKNNLPVLAEIKFEAIG